MIEKEQIVAGFNRGAKTYTQVASLQAQIAQNLSERLPEIEPQQVLEVGCGTGLFSQYLVKTYPQAKLVLTDISPAMIAECQQHLVNTANTEWHCMDGETITAKSAFDLITSCMTLHWFKELPASLLRFKQSLKKNGRLVFALLTENSLQEWRTMCQHFNYPVATPPFPAITELKKHFPEWQFSVETIQTKYANARAFLRTLKSLGATAARSGYQSLTAAQMRRLIRHFAHEIHVTYEVIYGEYQNV